MINEDLFNRYHTLPFRFDEIKRSILQMNRKQHAHIKKRKEKTTDIIIIWSRIYLRRITNVVELRFFFMYIYE